MKGGLEYAEDGMTNGQGPGSRGSAVNARCQALNRWRVTGLLEYKGRNNGVNDAEDGHAGDDTGADRLVVVED